MEVGVGCIALSRNAESILQLAAIVPRRAGNRRRILMEAARQLALDEALKHRGSEIDAVYVSPSLYDTPFFGSTGPV